MYCSVPADSGVVLHSKAQVVLDSNAAVTIDHTTHPVDFNNDMWYDSGTLANGQHTVTVTYTGSSSDAGFILDKFSITGTAVGQAVQPPPTTATTTSTKTTSTPITQTGSPGTFTTTVTTTSTTGNDSPTLAKSGSSSTGSSLPSSSSSATSFGASTCEGHSIMFKLCFSLMGLVQLCPNLISSRLSLSSESVPRLMEPCLRRPPSSSPLQQQQYALTFLSAPSLASSFLVL